MKAYLIAFLSATAVAAHNQPEDPQVHEHQHLEHHHHDQEASPDKDLPHIQHLRLYASSAGRGTQVLSAPTDQGAAGWQADSAKTVVGVSTAAPEAAAHHHHHHHHASDPGSTHAGHVPHKHMAMDAKSIDQRKAIAQAAANSIPYVAITAGCSELCGTFAFLDPILTYDYCNKTCLQYESTIEWNACNHRCGQHGSSHVSMHPQGAFGCHRDCTVDRNRRQEVTGEDAKLIVYGDEEHEVQGWLVSNGDSTWTDRRKDGTEVQFEENFRYKDGMYLTESGTGVVAKVAFDERSIEVVDGADGDFADSGYIVTLVR